MTLVRRMRAEQPFEPRRETLELVFVVRLEVDPDLVQPHSGASYAPTELARTPP
jgi:hypothetical protein